MTDPETRATPVDVAPVAYLHTLHMEQGQVYTRLSDDDGADEDEPSRTGFGIPGRDYSEEYAVTTVALYTATTLEALAAENARLRERLEAYDIARQPVDARAALSPVTQVKESGL